MEIVVCDIDEKRARALGSGLGVKWTTNVDEMLSDADVVAVNIATPTLTHIDLAMRAVEAGKSFFCEKPLCRSLKDARALANAVAARGLVGMVGYVYRFSPVFESPIALLTPDAAGVLPLGRPVTATLRIGGRGDHELWKHMRESSGGAISEMMVHMLDLALWYFGQVHTARLVANRLLRPLRTIDGRQSQVDAEDFVIALLEMDGGVPVMVEADMVTPSFNQYVEIQFEQGSFMGSIQGDFPSYVFALRDGAGYRAGRTLLNLGTVNLFEQQMAAFCDHLRNGTALSRNSINDSVKVLEVLELLRQSAE